MPTSVVSSVVVAGGGTAGHVEPALALADALRRADPDVTITALGTERGLETRLVPARGYELALVPRVAVPRRPDVALVSLPRRLASAVSAAASAISTARADVVVGFGGYVSAPAYLAARRLGVPFVVHEANARPGMANRLGARLTPFVAVATPGCPLPHARHVGLPIRHTIALLDRAAERAGARAAFGLPQDAPVLLVFGGSQGARRINEALEQALPELLAAGTWVLHAHGAANEPLDAGQAGPGRYVPVPYLDRMDLAYAAADLAVCRAGAMTCAELAAVGLPGLYVPLPHGNGEQRLNAEPVVAAGGGLLVPDAELDGARLVGTVGPLLADAGALARMGAAAGGFGRRDADERLADLVREAAASRPAPDPSPGTRPDHPEEGPA